MFDKLCFCCFFIFSGTWQIYAQNSQIEETTQKSTAQLVDLLISSSDLEIDQELILVHVNGLLYPIQSLRKSDTGWIATVDSAVNYCPQGHPNCGKCGLCHLRKCRYYIPPCWQ